MSAVRGIVAGSLGLALLQAFTASPTAAGNVGTLFKLTNSVASRLINPTVPLVPDLRK